MSFAPSTARLAEDLQQARARTLALVQDLQGDQWIGPELEIVNPPLWEIGHVAWFQELWVLRHALGRHALLPQADQFYNSAAVEHWSRWSLLLPPLERTLDYMARVQDAVLAALDAGPLDDRLRYFLLLALYHEDMHGEALLYTRQTLAYPAPRLERTSAPAPVAGPLPGDAAIPGGRFLLGAHPGMPFVFDNEKWAHPVDVRPFAIARAPVTEAEFAAFVDDAGYRRQELWTDDGWRWRTADTAEHPVYWRREGPGRWLVREFDRWRPLSPHRPVIHVNQHEARAFCRWAGRRLPTEAEWELAACGPCEEARHKRCQPWGDHADCSGRAHLDMASLHCADVGALPDGDSPYGCRQMIGNVWEWTADPFRPYPGFATDPYREYSEPWFETRAVLRGGCFATPGRLLRTTWRNFFTPERRDIFAGFRTAASG